MAEPREIHIDSHEWRQANAWRMKRFTGPKATVPGGHEIDATDYMDAEEDDLADQRIVAKPESVLSKPKKGFGYIWRLRSEDDTQRLIELGELRPVKFDELLPKSETVTLHGYQDSGMPNAQGERVVGTYVGWKKMALYEVSPELMDRWFFKPQRLGIKRVAQIPDELQDKLEQFGATKVTAKDKRNAEQERAYDARNST